MPGFGVRRTALACAAAALIGALAGTVYAQAPVKRAAQTKVAEKAPAVVHKVAIQVSENDRNVMNRALNNTRNLLQYYKQKGETAQIEIVTFHDGLHMLRSESPVKERIAVMALENPEIKFIACANTQTNQGKAEGKPVTLLSEAVVMPSGIVRLIELQKQGYSYIRP
jgi:intracellular sulfur oxidation DsrE/DsrF family protein